MVYFLFLTAVVAEPGDINAQSASDKSCADWHGSLLHRPAMSSVREGDFAERESRPLPCHRRGSRRTIPTTIFKNSEAERCGRLYAQDNIAPEPGFARSIRNDIWISRNCPFSTTPSPAFSFELESISKGSTRRVNNFLTAFCGPFNRTSILT